LGTVLIFVVVAVDGDEAVAAISLYNLSSILVVSASLAIDPFPVV